MIKRHRIFIAINLPEGVKKQLSLYRQKWPELPAKWVSADNLHITLSFLGNLTDTEVGEACIAVKEVVENYNSFELSLNKVTYGPTEKIPPKMVWVVGEKSKALSILRKNIEESISGIINFKPENRGLSPHITLAGVSAFAWRAIEPEGRPEVNENIDLSINVESVEVMESVLKKAGPKYSVLESYQLQ